MRTINITLDADRVVSVSSYAAGYIGEHNATKLVIGVPQDLHEVADCYMLNFDNEENCILSGLVTTNTEVDGAWIDQNGKINCVLWQQLTEKPHLKLTVEAYKYDNGELKIITKLPTISAFHFCASNSGYTKIAEKESKGLAVQIARLVTLAQAQNESDNVAERVLELLSEKVDKEADKGLSTNDYTTEEKTKLSGIETGAEVNAIEGITVNGTAVSPDSNKVVNLTRAANLSDGTGTGSIRQGEALAAAPSSSALSGGTVRDTNQNCEYAHADSGGFADGAYSHAHSQGWAIGSHSNASGRGTKTLKDDSTVVGKYGEVTNSPSSALFAVANGTDANNLNLGLEFTGEKGNGHLYIEHNLVPTDNNYVHTDNNYTTAEKTKLAGIQSGAKDNVIEHVNLNGIDITPVNKTVNIVTDFGFHYDNDLGNIVQNTYSGEGYADAQSSSSLSNGIVMESSAESHSDSKGYMEYNDLACHADSSGQIGNDDENSHSDSSGIIGDNAENCHADSGGTIGDYSTYSHAQAGGSVSAANAFASGAGTSTSEASSTIVGKNGTISAYSDVLFAVGNGVDANNLNLGLEFRGSHPNGELYVENVKVVTDNSYVHTDNNYTTAEKTKLSGIETGAEANDIEAITVNGTAVTVTNKTAAITAVQDDSYVHTDNNYTNAEKTKLSGIEIGAEVNDIEAITLNGTPVTVTNKTAAITAVQDNSYVHTDNNYTNSEKAKLSSVKLTEVIEANLVWTTGETPTVTLVTQNAYSKITSALTNGDTVVLAGHLFASMEGQAEPVDMGTLLFVKSFDYDLGGEASVSFMASPSDGLFYRLEIDNSNTTVFTKTSLDDKVDKETGKGLSTNDYTTADQNKLNGIASGAEVNVIESISYNGSPVSVVSKAVSINPDALTSLTEAASITLETNKKYYLTLASNASFVLPVSPSVLYDNQILVYLDCTADVDVSFPSGTLFYGGTLPDTSTGAHELIMTYNPAAGAWTVGGLDSEAVT